MFPQYDKTTNDHIEVTRQEAVLEDTAIRNIDTLTLVCDDWNEVFLVSKSFAKHDGELTDDRSSQSHIPAKVHISCDSQVIKLDNLRYLLESLLELLDLISNGPCQVVIIR